MITEVALRVRPVAAERRYEAWLLRSFDAGCEALRALAQAEVAPDVARLSDEDETRTTLALAGAGGTARRAGGVALRALGYRPGCLLIDGWEGEPGDVVAPPRARRADAALGRARSRSGAGRARPGAPRASPGRTCATRCSTAACWSRRSRRRRPGRGLAALHARGPRGAGAARCRRRRRSSAATSRTSIPTAPRSTSPCWRARTGRPGRPVARGQARRGDAIAAAGRDDHPPPRGRPRPRGVARGRARPARHRAPARGQGALRPRRDHEPREAAARLAALGQLARQDDAARTLRVLGRLLRHDDALVGRVELREARESFSLGPWMPSRPSVADRVGEAEPAGLVARAGEPDRVGGPALLGGTSCAWSANSSCSSCRKTVIVPLASPPAGERSAIGPRPAAWRSPPGSRWRPAWRSTSPRPARRRGRRRRGARGTARRRRRRARPRSAARRRAATPAAAPSSPRLRAAAPAAGAARDRARRARLRRTARRGARAAVGVARLALRDLGQRRRGATPARRAGDAGRPGAGRGATRPAARASPPRRAAACWPSR